MDFLGRKAMQNRCIHCRRFFVPNPRSKGQQYCGRKQCQRARKSQWQRRKMATDADYRKNQKEAQATWQENNPQYWRHYRNTHPEYVQNNRCLQKQRDARRRAVRLAKMDALNPKKHIMSGTYYLVPFLDNLAKMDALTQKINIITKCYEFYGSSCKEGLDRPIPFFTLQADKKEVCHDCQNTP